MRFSTKKFSPLAHSLYGSIIKGLMIQNISLNKPLFVSNISYENKTSNRFPRSLNFYRCDYENGKDLVIKIVSYLLLFNFALHQLCISPL